MSVVEAGIPAVATDAAACSLCAAHDTQPVQTRADRYDTLFPWAVALTVTVIVASLGIDAERWFGIGAIVGIMAGGAAAATNARRAGRVRQAATDRAIAVLSEEADARVATVIRQFEWAIADLAKLKREQDRAQVTADLLVVQGRARERHLRKVQRQLRDAQERIARLAAALAAPERPLLGAEPSDGAIPFQWGIHLDGGISRLELECDERDGVTGVRLVDGAGMTRMQSLAPTLSPDGAVRFVLADPPEELVAELGAGRHHGYRLQALRGAEWRPVRLGDNGLRTHMITDKQGHLYRVSDAAIALRRSATASEPYEYVPDATYLTL